MTDTNENEIEYFSRLMNAIPIRDGIMTRLSPRDAKLIEGLSGYDFGDADSNKYGCVFKYVIPNRIWLRNKVSNGYRFTILTSNPGKLMNAEKIVDSDEYVIESIDVVLIVTKDGNFIECGYEFMPTLAFEDKDGIVDVTWDTLHHTSGFPSRVVSMKRGRLTIRVTFPHSNLIVDGLVQLFGRSYSSVTEMKWTTNPTDRFTIWYSHMTGNGSTSLTCSKNVVEPEDRYACDDGHLFAIMGYHKHPCWNENCYMPFDKDATLFYYVYE